MRRLRRGRARWPKLLAIGALLAVAGGAGAWVELGRHPTAVRLATARIAPPRKPAPPPPPPELQARLEKLVGAYREPVGVAITDVDHGWTAQVNGEGEFPQQSVVKVWVALAVLNAVDHGALSLNEPVVVRPEDRSVFYQPLGGKIGRNGFSTTLYDLLHRQITESDNTANDKLISLLGGVGPVARLLSARGIEGVTVGGTEREMQARTAGLQWRPELAGWRFKEARAQLPDAVRDQALQAYLAAPPDGATPVGITEGLAALKRGEVLSKTSTETMLGLLSETRTGQSRLKAGLPSGWSIGHKTGTGPDWRGASVGINDVGLISAPDGHTYAVAVMIRETKKPVPARSALMQAVSRAVVETWRGEAHSERAAGERPAAES